MITSKIELNNPLHQGLKLKTSINQHDGMIIELNNPLHQGLKHKYQRKKKCNGNIELNNPLHQGLKHSDFFKSTDTKKD